MIPSPVGYIRAFVCHERNAIQGMVTCCISPNAEYSPSTFSILVHHLAKAIPAVTAAFVHALTWDTMPCHHGGHYNQEKHLMANEFRERFDDAGLTREYVEGVLFPRLIVARAPNAPWRLSTCRHAMTSTVTPKST